MPWLGTTYLSAFALEAIKASTTAIVAVYLSKVFVRMDFVEIALTFATTILSTFLILVALHVCLGGYGASMIDTTQTRRERIALGAFATR